MDNDKLLVTNIQRFCLHDGPGIRTTVFLKGCSLRCPWCSNPENMIPKQQHYVKDGYEGVYGAYMLPEDLIEECMRDRSYYDEKPAFPLAQSSSKPSYIDSIPGGVTFSGGEPLLQMDALALVCKQLHEKKVHLAVETCLFCSRSQLQKAIETIDLFYVDIKILDKNRCYAVEKGDVECFLSNFDILMNSKKNIIIRIPVIGTYTDDIANRSAVKDLLGKYKGGYMKIELIKEHNLGESKYRSLNWEMHYRGVSDELMDKYRKELNPLGVSVEICKI